MRTGIALGVGVLCFAIALVIRAPATLIDRGLEALSEGRVRVAEARGTLWNGSGDLRLPAADASMRIAWRLDALPLSWGELRGSVQGEDRAEPRAAFSVGRGFEVRNAVIALPSATVARIAGVPPALFAAEGTLSARSDYLAVSRDAIDGRIALRWDSAAVIGRGLDRRIALGDVRLDAAGQGRLLAGQLGNSGGDVEIDGSVQLPLEGAARIDAIVRPRAGIDAERARAIAGVLAVLGQPQSDGGYRIVWSAGPR